MVAPVFAEFLKTFPETYTDWSTDFVNEVKSILVTELDTVKKTMMDDINKRHENAVKSIKENAMLSDVEHLAGIDRLNKALLSILSRIAAEYNHLANVFDGVQTDLHNFQRESHGVTFDVYRSVATRQAAFRNGIFTMNDRAIRRIKDYQDLLDSWKGNI